MKKLITTLALVAVSGCLCANPANGKKVGVITSLGREGLFCPTLEGTLVRGGLNAGSGANGAMVTFNVAPGLEDKVQAAMDAGKEVEITYRRPLVSSVCDRENANDVTVIAIETK